MNFEEFKSKYEHISVEEYPNSVEYNPLISVCVITYNQEPFIRQCLDGVLMQRTKFSFEILLGDDASTDGTREICIEYAKNYPNKIRLFLHHRENNIQTNGHPTGRFNFLFNFFAAKGKYIALCEGDDYWTNSLKLEKQVDFLEDNPNYNLIAHNTQILSHKGLFDKEWRYNSKEITFSIYDYIWKLFFHTSSVLCRRVSIPQYLSSNNIIQGDIAYFLLAINNGKVHFIAEPMSVYRLHSGGITNNIHNQAILSSYKSQKFIYHNFNEYTSKKFCIPIFFKMLIINAIIKQKSSKNQIWSNMWRVYGYIIKSIFILVVNVYRYFSKP